MWRVLLFAYINVSTITFSVTAQEYYFGQLHDGEQLSLRRGVTATDYFSECLRGNDRNVCIERALYWGRYQVESSGKREGVDASAEMTRGWRFLELAFNELIRDLSEVGVTSKDLETRLASQGLAETRLSEMSIQWEKTAEFGSGAAFAAAFVYYFRVWDLLPAHPKTSAVFFHKVKTGEELTSLLRLVIAYAEPNDELMRSAWNFYAGAFEFHLLPVPTDVADDLGFDVSDYMGLGFGSKLPLYRLFPGDSVLTPCPRLAQRDVRELGLVLARMVESGRLSQAEYMKAKEEHQT